MDLFFNRLQAKSYENQRRNSSDYLDTDGFLCCGVCGDRKEALITFGARGVQKVGIKCACVEREETAEIEKKKQNRVEFRKERCFSQSEMKDFCFSHDSGKQPKLGYAKTYAVHWEEMAARNIGLLLIGGVGTGKSYAAAAIANFLCEKDISVKFCNLAELLNDLQSCPDRNAYIDSLMTFSLLVLDDFGIQRETDYVFEQTFNLIDQRYRCGKPLVVTTNLPYEELKNPKDIRKSRIFSRLLSICTPIIFDGPDLRRQTQNEKREFFAQFVSE